MVILRLDYCNSILTLRASGQTDRRYAGRESSIAQLDLSCGNLSESVVLFHCWKNWTGFRWNSEYRISTFAYRHLKDHSPHTDTVRVSRNLSAVSFSAILSGQFSQNPQNQAETLGQRSCTFLAPSVCSSLLVWCEKRRSRLPAFDGKPACFVWLGGDVELNVLGCRLTYQGQSVTSA